MLGCYITKLSDVNLGKGCIREPGQYTTRLLPVLASGSFKELEKRNNCMSLVGVDGKEMSSG